MTTQIDVGRVFFQYTSDGIPSMLRIIPLDCHVGNVAKLAENWQIYQQTPEQSLADPEQTFVDARTRPAVLSACMRHDQAKPTTFRITFNQSQKNRAFGYSFAGHRFRVPPKEPYEDALIRGHHDFSVADIVEAAYRIQGEYRDLLEPQQTSSLGNIATFLKEPRALLQRFRDDLYILEMCDQIEAELETRILDFDGEDTTTRNFMDFSIRHTTEQHSWEVEPFAWKTNPLTMDYSYIDLFVPESLQTKIRQTMQEGKETNPEKLLQAWLLEQLQHWDKPALHKTITLVPPPLGGRKPQPADMQHILGFPGLNPMQEHLCTNMQQTDGFGVLLRAPTGTGKTEAVVWPCLVSGRRLILALPARSLLDDHRQRIAGILHRAACTTGRRYTMIVDTGAESQRWIFAPQSASDIQKIDTLGGHRDGPRHLYKADIILTTMDKLLFRYFGFFDKTKSMIFPYRIHHKQTVLAFDEAHSYESLAWSNFRLLVRTLYEAGQDIVLMTATMPKKLLDTFSFMEVLDFVHDEQARTSLDTFFQQQAQRKSFAWNPRKTLNYIELPKIQDETDQAYELRQEETLLQHTVETVKIGVRRIIIVVNTVRSAVSLFCTLQKNAQIQQCDNKLVLYHGRLAEKRWLGTSSDEHKKKNNLPSPRSLAYQELKQLDNDHNNTQKGYILVTTQAIEVGCDLDAECLFTVLCNPDALIQRAGRCNRRHQYPNARVIVVGNYIPEFLQVLSPLEHDAYLSTLRIQSQQAFVPAVLDQHFPKQEQHDDPRLLELFSMLYDYVYNGDVLHEQIHKRGLIITRSWQPSVTLRCQHSGETHECSVPIEQLKLRNIDGKKEEPPDGIHVRQLAYSSSFSRYHEVPFYGGDAYSIPEIIIECPQIGSESCLIADGSLSDTQGYSTQLGWHELPRIFDIWQPRGSFKKLAVYLNPEKQKRILRYLAPLEQEK